MATELPELDAPDAVYVRQRWIPEHKRQWAQRADEILREHGAVCGREEFKHRYQARWRAQRLIRLLVELRLRERWELKEHTQKRGGHYVWSVEYTGKGSQ